MTHANPKDRFRPLVNRLPNVECGVHTVLGITRTVSQEQSVELVSNGVEVKVPRKDGDGRSSRDERTENVGFGAKVEYGNFDVSFRVERVDFAS